ncbi:glucose 1-dehydrogenase [Candidatus Bipolaricaulota bacterium]|nr:glucose 1-dehydrogenase [Candidatus Bipolaricaulota bacterium]
MRLQGKVAIITGGNSGIGRATALLFSQEGAKVVIAARNEARGQETTAAIKRSGGEALFLVCDVRRAIDCERVAQRTVEEFSRLDILFNSASVVYPDRIVLDTSEEEWNQTMDVNAKGVYLMCKYAIPHMIEHGSGVIVNTASVWGLVGGNGAAAYCASKGAVVLLTKAMALDHAHQNIRVNCICPGSVDTPMVRREMEALGGAEKARPIFAAKHPLNRISTPEEVAKSVLFLVSDDASFITGASLAVDGGRTAGEVVVGQ